MLPCSLGSSPGNMNEDADMVLGGVLHVVGGATEVSTPGEILPSEVPPSEWMGDPAVGGWLLMCKGGEKEAEEVGKPAAAAALALARLVTRPGGNPGRDPDGEVR